MHTKTSNQFRQNVGHTQKTSYCSSFHWSKKSRKWQHLDPGNLLKSPNLLRQPCWRTWVLRNWSTTLKVRTSISLPNPHKSA
jgi:hypothetical protein